MTPLCDNIAGENYYYQISVYTGMRKGSGTKSNVNIVLSGDNADTGVRSLQDYNNRVSIFIIKTVKLQLNVEVAMLNKM